jgi:predicted phage gp36 major capsid-like protein
VTPERIAKLRALCEAATPGPWERLDLDGAPTPRVGYRIVSGGIERSHIAAESRKDAALIAAARSALPEALAEIERLTKERDEAIRERQLDNDQDAAEIERLTAERDAAEAERDAARSGRSYFQDLADRRGDALLALGHDYFDAEHTRWCEPCRRVREGGGE